MFKFQVCFFCLKFEDSSGLVTEALRTQYYQARAC